MTYNKRSSRNKLLNTIIISLLVLLIESKVNLLYPIAFTVVRYSSISGNLSQYMQNIGYPSID